ncbi:snRNA-activating protein of 50kDa MW C terminal-domain-containing protein [Neocallimastix sp. 'constans']
MLKEIEKSKLNSLYEDNHLIVPLKKRRTLNFLEKIENYKNSDSMYKNMDLHITEENIIRNNDIILNIEFYCQDDPSRVIDEFEVYGDQKLSELRDAFICPTEPVDLFSNKAVERDFNKIPSSFFIENVFYNNFSDNIKDHYSSNIINWVYKKRRFLQPGLGRFISKKMDDISFKDLSIRMNYPYLYIHHNNCKHIMIFTNVRLVHKNDDRNIKNYPKLIYKGWIKNNKCKLCANKLAKWITYDDMYASDNPCIWCQDCFDNFHKDKDGNLLYDNFKILPLFIYPSYS